MGFAYKITDQLAVHFITCTVVQWADIFTRAQYSDIVVDSIRHCQEKKGLKVYGWVIMSNHLHMICSGSGENDLSDILRDFKKFTSTAIVNAIESNPRESRRSWLMWLLKQNNNIQFWQEGNHPEEIRTRDFFKQKLDYIHNNPIRAGWIDIQEAYTYSSARDYCGVKGLIELSYFE